MEFQRTRLLVWLVVLGVLPLLLATGLTAYDFFLGHSNAKDPEEPIRLAGQANLHIAESLAERADKLVENAIFATEKMYHPKLANLDPDDLDEMLSSQPSKNQYSSPDAA